MLVVFLYVYILELSKATSQSKYNFVLFFPAVYSYKNWCVDAKCVVDKCLYLQYLQLSNDDYFVFVDWSTPYERANFNLYKEIIMP